MIGIEHFLVEQVSRPKKGKRVSVVEEKKKYIQNLIEGFDIDNANPDEIKDVNEKLSSVIYDIAVKANTTGIEDLKQSFYTVFENHLSKVREYRNTLNESAEGKPFKLAFLIELRCNADDIYCNNGRTVKRRTNDVYPIMTWMVEELEKIDSKLVDYVVLYLRNSVNEEIEDVVAVNTNDIRGSLRKQDIVIYEYCDDPSRIRFRTEMSEKGMEYYSEVENESTFMKDLIPSLKQAYQFKKNSIPFVASRAIQEMMFAFGRASFMGEEPNILISSQYSQKETLQRFDQFTSTYS